jgi:hypothetical protein
MTYAQLIIAYMESLGYDIARGPHELNIVYVEGADLDGTPNADDADRFNDLGLLIEFDEAGQPQIVHRAVCTTEPGYAATMAQRARLLGGVARVQLTQYKSCWQMGFHKSNPAHPALVQRAPMLVHRDRNRDGKRPGDLLMPASGINQHGTRPGMLARLVGTWSEGCLVRLNWDDHLHFIGMLKTDPRYVQNPAFLFSAAILDGGKVWRYQPAVLPS